jgi:hypothetical protein
LATHLKDRTMTQERTGHPREEGPASLEANLDSNWDTSLRRAFEAEPEPEDDGFTARVMAGLPQQGAASAAPAAQRLARERWQLARLAHRAHRVYLAASSVAGLMLAAMSPSGLASLQPEQRMGCWMLIGLMAFWSLQGWRLRGRAGSPSRG